MSCKSLAPGPLAARPAGRHSQQPRSQSSSVAAVTRGLSTPRPVPSFVAGIKRWESAKPLPIKAVSDPEAEAEHMAGFDSGEFDDVIGASPILEPRCGANLDATRRGCVFRVWAPAAKQAFVFLYDDGDALSEERKAVPMDAEDGGYMSAVVAGVEEGQLYHFGFTTHWDEWHVRRDPYARATQRNTSDSLSCVVTDFTNFEWTEAWETPTLEKLVLYECHIGSFTGYHDPEISDAGLGGTFKGMEARLQHIADSGFTALQLMPVLEYSGSWGYNPRLLFPTHEGYGTPEELRSLVDAAHQKGIAVIFDCVLHHGAVKDNSLWNYDGWNNDGGGGIYHEGGAPTGFGTAFAFWKEEVKEMLYDSCAMFFREYNADGIRVDAAQILPWDLQKRLAHGLKHNFPGKFIIAESNPCDPSGVHEAGYDALWDFSSTFEGLKPARSGKAWEKLNLNHVKNMIGLKPGFSHPLQMVKFMLGSHDQIGCRKNGGHHQDTRMVHRYPVEYMGGREDWTARALSRMWYAIQCTGQGIPMAFMGIEVLHGGFWHIDEHHRFNWDFAKDEWGKQSMAATHDINVLRSTCPALGYGSLKVVHEDWHNGIIGFERHSEIPAQRLMVVINSGSFQADDASYGLSVHGGPWAEIYNSQSEEYGGWATSGNGGGESTPSLLHPENGSIHIRLPKYSVLVFEERHL